MKNDKKFFDWLPLRTQLLWKAGMVSEYVLLEWYEEYLKIK